MRGHVDAIQISHVFTEPWTVKLVRVETAPWRRIKLVRSTLDPHWDGSGFPESLDGSQQRWYVNVFYVCVRA